MKHRKVLIGLVLVLLCSLTIHNYRYFDIFSVTKLQDVKLKFQGTLPSHNMSSSSSSSSSPGPSNRTLVILVGGIRGNEKVWSTLYQNLLDTNMADLALMAAELPTDSRFNTSSLFERAKYVWHYPHYHDWADAMDLINGTGWRQTHLPLFPTGKKSTILFGGIHGFAGSGMILFMLRWFLSQHLQEHGVVDKYDRFVVTRPDHYYQCRCSISDFDLNNTLWVPEGEDYSGVCDRFYVVSKENLLNSLDLIPPLLSKPFVYECEKHCNTEQFLKASWKEKRFQIKRFPRSMFTCATRNDTVSWKSHSMSVLPGIIIPPYRTEYNLTIQTCTFESTAQYKALLAENKALKSRLKNINHDARV